jgi:hypothetical protein
MTISVTPSERDLRTMLDIVNADPADPPPGGLPLPVLDALCRLIPADLLSFFGLDSGGQTGLFMQDFPAEEPGDDDAAAFWSAPRTAFPAPRPGWYGRVQEPALLPAHAPCPVPAWPLRARAVVEAAGRSGEFPAA